MKAKFTQSFLASVILSVSLTAISQPAYSIAQIEYPEAIEAYNSQDYQKALEIFYSLDKDDFAPAQYMLGLMYSEGKGVEQNYQKALFWYQKSAQSGYHSEFAPAEYMLGLMHSEGKGVEQNKSIAKEYFYNACLHSGEEEKLGCDEWGKLNEKGIQ